MGTGNHEPLTGHGKPSLEDAMREIAAAFDNLNPPKPRPKPASFAAAAVVLVVAAALPFAALWLVVFLARLAVVIAENAWGIL